MPVKVGILSAAHVHAPSFAHCIRVSPKATLVGVWDDDPARGSNFADQLGVAFEPDLASLLKAVDAVIICSENMKHVGLIEQAAAAGKAILCEKPVAPTKEHGARIESAVTSAGVLFMTAFPCPFSPGFKLGFDKVKSGELGKILAISAMNQGRCPFGWFTDVELSGGGAMADHLVHAADLIYRLLGEEPGDVQAHIGSGIYGQTWEDTAIVSLKYPSGTFATIDGSWSKSAGYPTWGNVKLNVVGEKGVIELDLFAQGPDFFGTGLPAHLGTASNLDSMMIEEFLDAFLAGREPTVTLAHGLAASQVVWKAYASLE